MRLLALILIGLLVPAARAQRITGGQTGPGVPDFGVYPGYRVTLAADDLPEARFIESGADGSLYLSQPGRGAIVRLRDADGDGVFETRTDFVTGMPTVHGMHFVDGRLWFAQSGAIHNARDTDGDGKADEIVTVIADGQLPKGGGHWFRTVLVTPDGLYTSIGDSGNANDETKTDRQKIWRYNLDGSGKKLFASGLRNTEKLRLRPGTDEVWGADHGSDWWGRKLGDRDGRQPFTDHNPPDEFNHYVQDGFYGHPFITGNRVPRFEYLDRPDILELGEKTIPPAWANGPHWANNGWDFLTKDYFPEHQGDAIIAFHGSWNRQKRAGYCVQRILFDKITGRPYGARTIVDCLGPKGQVLERPVDIAEAPDGSILFSGDSGRRIYRISKLTTGN